MSAELTERIRQNVPQILRDLPVWLLHGPDKTPICADGANRNGNLDSPEDRSRLVTFEEAAKALPNVRRAVGFGIALGEVPGEEIHLSGQDFDGCYRDGELDERVTQIMGAADSYAERSPSGNGIHILGTGNIGTLKVAGAEIYSAGRYFTVTGNRINGAHLADIADAAALTRRMFGTASNNSGSALLSSEPRGFNGDEIVSALAASGLYLRDAGGGKHLIRCPWEARHTPNESGDRQTSSSEAAYFAPGAAVRGTKLDVGMFRCQHQHCTDRRLKHLREYLGLDLPAESADPLESIRVAIVADLTAGPEAIDAAEPPRFIQYPHLPEAGANLCAPGETGKTALALNEKIRVALGMPLYLGAEPQTQGPCVLVTAEDGAARGRYVLQRALRDGMDSGQLTATQAQAAKESVRIVGWNSPKYGRIVKVDPQTGEMYRAPVYDLLLELLATIKPVYVTLDPEALFAPGERYGNDGHAFLAAMIHETAMAMQACVQMLDHVSQNVARSGTVDQYASRGGTAKSDEARLVRQLVTVRADMLKEDSPRPLMVTDEDIAKGSVLQLHWTKLSWAPKHLTGTPLWLRRRGYWFESLKAPTQIEHAEESEQQTAERDLEELQTHAGAVVDYIRQQLATGTGIRVTASELANEGGPAIKGKPLKRDPIRRAIRHAMARGLLKQLDLPKAERKGSRQTYLAPADYDPPTQQEASK